MSRYVQRFCVYAYPAKDHPIYYEWQTAQLVILVGEDSKNLSLEKAKRKIEHEHWVSIEFEEKAILIEERVRESGGELWEAYCQAKEGEMFFRSWLDDPIELSTKQKTFPPMLPPRLNEPFIDKVIKKTGGHRLGSAESNFEKTRNADYILDNYIFELKDIQQEGLEVKTRQKKLAKLFKNRGENGFVLLDPGNFSETEYRKYLDIIGGPIKTQVKSASDQIKKSKAHLNDQYLQGGVIFLNTGYYSLPHSIFAEAVERFSQKDSKQISLVVCISNMVLTIGFDSTTYFYFHPEHSHNETVDKLHQAFMNEVGNLMTSWGRGGFGLPEVPASTLKPIFFEEDRKTYGVVPRRHKSSITD
jgi:hypothetical protein